MDVGGASAALGAAACMLRVSETVVRTALAFFHRHLQMVGAGDGSQTDSVLAACLFLASKVEDEPRRSRDVLNTMTMARHSEPLRSSRQYWILKEQLVQQEQVASQHIASSQQNPP